jgi:hypothetical protein
MTKKKDKETMTGLMTMNDFDVFVFNIIQQRNDVQKANSLIVVVWGNRSKNK